MYLTRLWLYLYTVDSVITHTPLFPLGAMGYEGVWVQREEIKGNLYFGRRTNLWVTGVYVLIEVWVITEPTVAIKRATVIFELISASVISCTKFVTIFIQGPTP